MNLENRYDFVYLFDVRDGNPNGDPDAGNLPRVDAETGLGLVTDVCLKRKVRNFVSLVKHNEPPHDIYIKEKAVLNRIHETAYQRVGAGEALLAEEDKGSEPDKTIKPKRKGTADTADKAREWICRNYYDVRTFGAVMSTGVNCGQVRGPVQMTFARSIDPIISQEHAITRMAVVTQEEAERQAGENRSMGRKFTVPYGLYRCHGFISAHLAQQTGFSEDDLKLFLQALEYMFEHDRSAARGEMTVRGIYIFKHKTKLGNAPAHHLFERVTIALEDESKPAKDFGDYRISINEERLPSGVELIQRGR